MGVVYCVTCKINDKKYIGKTVNLLKYRQKEHERETLKGSNLVFHNALRKYKIDNFEWEELFINDNDFILCKVEIMEIVEQNTKIPNGYNMTDGGEGVSGLSQSAIKGKTYEEIHGEEKAKELKEKRSKCRKGIKITLEVKKKMSLARKGKTYEEMYGEEKAKELKEKVSKQFKGKKRPPFSEEWLKNMSNVRIGKKRKPHTKETKLKMSISAKNRIETEAIIEGRKRAAKGISKYWKGRKRKPFSKEHKRKMSEAAKRRCAK